MQFGVGVDVGVRVEVGVELGVGVSDGIGVSVGVRVAVGVPVGVAVCVGVAVIVAVRVGVGVGVHAVKLAVTVTSPVPGMKVVLATLVLPNLPEGADQTLKLYPVFGVAEILICVSGLNFVPPPGQLGAVVTLALPALDGSVTALTAMQGRKPKFLTALVQLVSWPAWLSSVVLS